jgi:hypothetical protein
MEPLWITLSITLVVTAGWHLTHRLVAARIRTYITERGGTVVSCAWQPKSRGGHGSPSVAHYCVRYLDAGGRLHEAACNTRVFSAVYFTHDEIVGTHGIPVQFVTNSNPDDCGSAVEGDDDDPTSRVQIADLEREVRRLRKRLREEIQSPPAED